MVRICPAMTFAQVLQSASPMRPSVKEQTFHGADRDLMNPVVGRVRKVPVASQLDTVCVVVVRVITHRKHVLLSACPQNVCTCHVTLDLCAADFLVALRIAEELPTMFALGTPCHTTLVVAIRPSVRPTCVLQCPCVVPASVQKGARHPTDRDFVCPVVGGMRKVPATTDIDTLAIVVVRMVTHRPETPLFTGFSDVLRRNAVGDFGLPHVIAVIVEIDTGRHIRGRWARNRGRDVCRGWRGVGSGNRCGF